MNKWKQISWRDAIDKNVFDDELGFIHVNSRITYSVAQQEINRYYVEGSNGQKIRLSIDGTNISKVKSLFGKIVYMERADYYGRATNFPPFEVETINSVISYRRIQNQNRGYGSAILEHSFPIYKKNKEQLDYLRYV